MQKKIRTALTVLLAAAFLTGAVMTVRQQLQYQKILADSEEAAQLAGLLSQRKRTAVPLPSPVQEEAEPLPEEAAALAGIDLEALQAVNEDVVGWIAIPGTELSYPLLQGEDNQYYLTHNWKQESSSGGAVFLESTSDGEMGDFHTIIYAHRMRNDSMFGTLKYYEDLDFWREHPRVYVALDGVVCCYDIFSAQEASVTGIVYRLDLEEAHLEEDFLQYCQEGSVLDTGLTPTASDRILTLSTCTGRGHATRWTVHAVLRTLWAVE